MDNEARWIYIVVHYPFFFSTYPHSDKLLLITISQTLRLLLHEQKRPFFVIILNSATLLQI